MPHVLISVGRRDVQYVNHIDGRTGTLWNGRYKSSLVHADTDLLLCQRYIELNPVRTGLEADPALHRWSSDRANSLGEADALLTPHALYLGLGNNEGARRTASTASCSAERSTTNRSAICGSHPTKTSPSAMIASIGRSKR